MPKDTTKPYTSSHRKLPYPSVCSSSVGAQQPTASSTHQDVASLIYDRHASASWPPDKDELLLKARQQGLNWQPIASQYFPEKSANACRKRHERLMEKRNNIDDWDISKMERLAKAYNDVREQMWGLLADRMGGEKWQVVESRCMEKGLKTLQTAGRTATRRERTAHHLQPSPDIEENRYLLQPQLYERSKSHPSSEMDESFNDSAIGPDPAEQPFSTSFNLSSPPSVQRNAQAIHPYRPSYAESYTPPSRPPVRTFSDASLSSLSSAAGFTPMSTQLPSQISNVRHSPTPQKLPSFSAAFGISTGMMRAPVTCGPL